MSYNISLSKIQRLRTIDERDNVSMIPYALAMRIITYVILCIQLDMSYALSEAYGFLRNLSESHMRFMNSIFMYL